MLTLALARGAVSCSRLLQAMNLLRRRLLFADLRHVGLSSAVRDALTMKIQNRLVGGFRYSRRGRDSNPRSGFTPDNALAVRPFRPLRHLSLHVHDSVPSERMKLFAAQVEQRVVPPAGFEPASS